MLNDPNATALDGAMPIIETRRGMRGVMLHGLWMPLAIMGGDDGDTSSDPPPNNPPNPDSKPDDKPKPDDDDSPASRTIRALRDELKAAKAESKRANDLQAKIDEYEKAQLGEKERLERERDEANAKAVKAEATARERLIRAEVRIVANELGFADPSDAWRFLDISSIELDDDGEPKDVKPSLEKLLKDKPYLAKADDKTGTKAPPKQNGSNHLSREEQVAAAKKQLAESGRFRI